jgi:3-ketosteroid 9alpha-monooxygenase subunit A
LRTVQKKHKQLLQKNGEPTMTKYTRIEAAAPPSRYGRGWHCAGHVNEFDTTPRMIEAFGTKLVAFRGEDGVAHVLDGYCPHMGGDLSKGWVEGDSIRCPFHAWKWGADGVCNDIPYAKRIPPRACIKSWPVMEENNLLFVWNDPEDNAPIEEQRPPRMEECFNGQWTDWVIQEMTIHTNSRELVDNMADKAHFAPVHGAGAIEFRNIFDRHICVQEMTGKSPRLAEDSILVTRATYYGPAYMITEMDGQMHGMDIGSRLLVAHVPVTPDSFLLRYGVMVRKNPAFTEQQNADMAAGYVKLSQDAFFEDVAIWHSKTRVDNPVLCDGDGPINRLRQWYDQFYVDAKDVPPQMRERREYTVDAINPIPAHRLAG